MAEHKESIIVLTYPGCIFFEVALAIELLAEKYEILIAAPEAADFIASNGVKIQPDLDYASVDLGDCKAILIPGGDPGTIKDNERLDEIISAANDRSILLGAICAGPFVLAKAGVLKSRTIAHGYGPEQLDFLKEFFEGTTLTDELFVSDGNVLTARPEAHIDFAVEVACRLGTVDASKSGRLKEYHRGTLGRKIRPLALGLIRNKESKILLHKAVDSLKKETFYRPLGGGIEFHETGIEAIVREIKEELSFDAVAKGLIHTFENIFSYEGVPGHEVIFLYEVEFSDEKAYGLQQFEIKESENVIGEAVWRSLEEIASEGSKLYPQGLEKFLGSRC